MAIVWYGDNTHDFLVSVETSKVETVCDKAIKDGYMVKEVIAQ